MSCSSTQKEKDLKTWVIRTVKDLLHVVKLGSVHTRHRTVHVHQLNQQLFNYHQTIFLWVCVSSFGLLF